MYKRKNPFQIVEAKNSNGIISVGYNPTTSELEVRFRGLWYRRYAGVPGQVFESLKKARSTAKFLYDNINGKYVSSIPAKPAHEI
jgi:hypothetical protein